MYKTKADILKDFPEIELTQSGDFKINDELVNDYEIIDFHCHLFHGLKELFPKFLRKADHDLDGSFFDISCFPISIKHFDFNKVHFTNIPGTIFSLDGIKTRIVLFTGNMMWRKSTPARMIRDMRLNNISKAVVLQIDPPDCEPNEEMDKIIKEHKELITFGSIHPNDSNISSKIEKYLSLDIKGWKLNPHAMGIEVDSKCSIELLKELAETDLPILSCSGLAFSNNTINSGILSKKLKRQVKAQNIERFYQVLKEIPNATFIFAHGGCYQTQELIELMKKYPNTYTDISTQPPEHIKMLIKELGSERLLYGTDYPVYNHVFPMVSVLRATNNIEERKNIFANNAKRLLHI